MSSKKYQYGLFIPKQRKSADIAPRHSAFLEDDNEEPRPAAKPQASSTKPKMSRSDARVQLQAQMAIDKAISDDPSVFLYDEIYDDIKETSQTSKLLEKGRERKPRYIQGLMKAAKQRQREYERRTERKVQREREFEGDEFEGKESFVTSSYLKKMEEQRADEEEERRIEELEKLTDVTKQRDLSGFYKFMLNKRTESSTAKTSQSDKKVKEEKPTELDRDTKEFVEQTKTDVCQSSSSSSEDTLLDEAKRIRSIRSSAGDRGDSIVIDEKPPKRRKSSDASNDEASTESDVAESPKHLIPTTKERRLDSVQATSQSEKEITRPKPTDVDIDKPVQIEPPFKRPEPPFKEPEPQSVAKLFNTRHTGVKLLSAKERYLARKARAVGPEIAPEKDQE